MADQKLTALDEITAITNDDLLYVVDDPGGSPVSKKITVANFVASAIMPDGIITIPYDTPPVAPVAGNILLYADYKTSTTTDIPLMTSATAPSGEASDSEHYPDTEAWRAMGGDYNGWLTNASALPQWMQYQFDSAIKIGGYAIRPWFVDNYPGRTPKSWTFLGSNNGSDWDTLDTISGWASSNAADCIFFPCRQTTAYDYYRINVTENNGNPYTGIGRFRIYGVSSNLGLFVMNSDGTIYEVNVSFPHVVLG